MAKKKNRRNKARKRAAARASSMGGGGGEGNVAVGGQEVREMQMLEEHNNEEEGGVASLPVATSAAHAPEPTEDAVVVESAIEPATPTTTTGDGVVPSEAEGQEEDEDVKAYLLERAPDYFICPLSLDLMSNPVVAHDGLFYEKSIIEAHCNYCLQNNKPVISPITGLEIPPILTEAVVFRDMIRRYIDNELKARETRRAQGGP